MTDQAWEQLSRTISEHLAKRIREGALVDESVGMNGLFDELEKLFGNQCNEVGHHLNKKWLSEHVKKLLWTEGPNGTLSALKESVKRNVSPKVFHKHHPYIPFELVEKRVKELRGLTPTMAQPQELVAGINRLTISKQPDDFHIPTTSAALPFSVKVQNAANFKFTIMNGINFGVRYPGLIEDNTVRQALSNAERIGCDAVFITNLIDIDMSKASGPLKALRALFSGRNINVAILDPTYQKKAAEILHDMPVDEMVYETANEAFENLVSGLRRVCRMPDKEPYQNKPEYSGKVYIVFGYKEEDFVCAATYWHAMYHTIRRRAELDAEERAAKSALTNAIKNGARKKEINEKRREVARVVNELTRSRVTNVTPQEWQRFYPMVLAHVIKQIEEAIPNSKVIGVNTTRCMIGGKSVELHIPGHLRVTDTLLSNCVKVHGPKTLRETLADLTIVCHPYALNGRVTVRERDAKGKRGHAYFAVAPICVNAQFLREECKTIVRQGHPIGRIVFNEQCHTGMLLVECINGILQPPSVLSIGTLDKFRMRTEDFKRENEGHTRIPLMEHPNLKYIWYMIFTDPHIGSRARETIWCEETESRLGMFESVAHLMRREGLLKDGRMPIHFASSNDDITQANHYGTHLQPHVHEMSSIEIEDVWRKEMQKAREAHTKGDVLKIFAEMQEFMLYQIHVRGLDWATSQVVEAFERLVEPQVDVFDAILARAKKSGLIIRGASEFEGVRKNSTDPGVISIGSGNHFTHMLENQLVEGPIFAQALQSALHALPHWHGKRDELKKLVRAPLHGNRFISYGTVSVPGGYEWGLEMRDKPTGGIDWNDPLRRTVTKEMTRGNPPRMLEGKVIIKSYGDKHFLVIVITEWGIFIMALPGTATDMYGELGFPPNNTGITFLGFSKDGPDGGPMLCRALLYKDLRHYIENKVPFDWEKFLPNPA